MLPCITTSFINSLTIYGKKFNNNFKNILTIKKRLLVLKAIMVAVLSFSRGEMPIEHGEKTSENLIRRKSKVS